MTSAVQCVWSSAGRAGSTYGLSSNPRKRWWEVFILVYSPFWILWDLCILVPFKLYEVSGTLHLKSTAASIASLARSTFGHSKYGTVALQCTQTLWACTSRVAQAVLARRHCWFSSWAHKSLCFAAKHLGVPR